MSAPAFDAYPSAFEVAGFVVEAYEETKDWRRLLEGVLPAILEREAELSQRISTPLPGHAYAPGPSARPPELADSRRTRFCVRLPN